MNGKKVVSVEISVNYPQNRVDIHNVIHKNCAKYDRRALLYTDGRILHGNLL